MSYNTRRQGTGGGRGSSQVMYHQQQQQTPSSRSVGPVRSSAPMQNTQGYPSSYNSQPSGGGYSSGGNQGYNAQQYQAQTQQPPMAQQAVPPPPPPPVSIQQPPAPKPLHGILKSEPTSQQSSPAKTTGPAEVEDADKNTEQEPNEEEENEGRSRPPWMKKKPFGFKVNKTLKRRRQNARLRKLLQPKNAIMVLNELVTGVKFVVQEHVTPLSRMMFQVSTEIDGNVYTGQALSKTVAKQIAAENALKAIILDKMNKSPMKMETSLLEKGDDASSVGGGAGMSDGEENADKNIDIMEDDVPWKSLTSFAIYKLFLEWQSESPSTTSTTGTPKPGPGKPGPQSDGDNTPKPMKKPLVNPTERHPVMLLNQLRPGIEFTEVSRTGNPPDMVFTIQTVVNNKTFTGTGNNKKEAKKEAAKAALAGALDIHYP